MDKKFKNILKFAILGTIIFASIVILVFLNNFSFNKEDNITKEEVPDEKYNPNITKDSKEIFTDDDALYSYVKKFGPKETIGHLNQLSLIMGNCHTAAHEAGHFAYEIYNEEAFKSCSSECHSGCYHGATEAYFAKHGTADLSKNLNLLCNSELNSFFSHQCIHGIGHGLMAWSSYELPEALKSCDLLERQQDSCWTGVFMENIVGGLAEKDIENNEDADHFTKYLNDDPQYPCNVVEEKYKGACYFLQSSRMLQLFNSDFKKVADACLKTGDSYYQQSCFKSMGRDVGGRHARDVIGAINACLNAPEGPHRIACLSGAVQDTFWDPTGQDVALNFCSHLTDTAEKNACYNVIFNRAKEIFSDNGQFKFFCANVEPGYQAACPRGI